MITGYLQSAKQRLTELGGFWQVESEHLSAPLAAGADVVLMREEPGLTTIVLLLPSEAERSPEILRDHLLSMADGVAQEASTEVLALMLLATAVPLDQERYDRWHSLKVHRGAVRLIPWTADLVRQRLFEHEGPPFGTNPDLSVLTAPQPSNLTPPVQPQEEVPRFYVTFGLIGLIVGIWIAMTGVGYLQGADQMTMLDRFGAAVRPDLWLQGEYWRLFTAGFLHIGVAHLAVNSFSLWVVGRAVEFLYGPRRMLYIFVVAGVAGAAGSALLGIPVVLSAGASGAIFGLLGAVIWYRFSSPLGDRIAWKPLLLTLGLNLAIGLSLQRIIDNWNHLGGLVGGLIASAAVGVPLVAGMRAPHFHLKAPLRAILMGALGLTAIAVVVGVVPLPGPGREFAQSLTAFDEGRYAEAEVGFARAARRQPDQPYLRFVLGAALYNQGKCDAAAQELEFLQQKAPDYVGTERLAEAMQSCPPGG